MKTKILIILVLAMTVFTSCVEQEELRCVHIDFELETIAIMPEVALFKVINKSVSLDHDHIFVPYAATAKNSNGYSDGDNDYAEFSENLVIFDEIRHGQNYIVTIDGRWQPKDFQDDYYYNKNWGNTLTISYPIQNFSFRTPINASDAVGVSNLVTVNFTAKNISSTYANVNMNFKFNYGYEYNARPNFTFAIYSDPELKNLVNTAQGSGYEIYLSNLSPDTEYFCKSVVIDRGPLVSADYPNFNLPAGTIIESEEVFSFRTKP